MKYILLCGGEYEEFKTPKHLLKVNGEVLIERTIRLLKENGIKDIAVSTNNPAFNYLDVPILKHDNYYEENKNGKKGEWLSCFYPTNKPVCYIFGDVYFSDEAIKTIINTKVDDIEMFGSIPPFDYYYTKTWVEPFALKVADTKHLKESIEKTRQLAKEGKTWRKVPIMWELWTVIKDVPLQTKAGEYIYNYVKINDYTTDIDDINDIDNIERALKIMKGGMKMVKCEVINQNLTVREWQRLKNIKRVKSNNEIQEPNSFEIGDAFETDEEFASYLAGETPKQPIVCIKVLEVIPEKKEVKIEQPKEEKKYPKKIEKKPITKKVKKVK